MAIYAICSSVASILTKIRNPFNINNVQVEDDWLYFVPVPSYCLLMAFIFFVAIPLKLNIVSCMIVTLIGAAIQCVLAYSVIYWNTYTPFQLVGAKGKLMIEIIPAVTAAVWHQYLVFKLGDLFLSQLLNTELGPIFLLLSCTTYFHLILHFLHRAYDITGKDVILGLTMQVFCFMVCGGLFIRIVVLLSCVTLSICRYKAYAVPNVIPHPPKKELMELV